MTAGHPTGITLAGLQQASDAGELYLAYQPKLCLRTGQIIGAEALARWDHPQLGHIEPSSFIATVEAEGWIDWFTEWALETAIRQWSRWRANDLDLEMAVNISALNLAHVSFPDLVADMCTMGAVDPERLTLELTESASQDATRLMDTIARFRLKGIGISLDDFGTGFGSLVQLRSLPFSELKIDRRFVTDLLVSRDSRAITRGLIAMAHEMGLHVTAEGVEDYPTLEVLTAFGCDKAQGFVIAAAMPGDRLENWLGQWQRYEAKGTGNCRVNG